MSLQNTSAAVSTRPDLELRPPSIHMISISPLSPGSRGRIQLLGSRARTVGLTPGAADESSSSRSCGCSGSPAVSPASSSTPILPPQAPMVLSSSWQGLGLRRSTLLEAAVLKSGVGRVLLWALISGSSCRSANKYGLSI